MEFSFKAEVVLVLEHTKGDKTSKGKETNLLLTPYPPLDKKMYVKPDGHMTAEGAHAMMRVLTNGLSATIHYMHINGFEDSAKNLRKVIEQLETEFINVPTISTGTMPESHE